MKIINDSEEFCLYILEQKMLVPDMTILEHMGGYIDEVNQHHGTDYQLDDLKHLINAHLKQAIEQELRIK